jgi:phosphoglycolate phosphatase
MLSVPPADILYVGDSGVDMQTACAVGMYPLGVLWGFRSSEELLGAGAQALIERPLDLLSLLSGPDCSGADSGERKLAQKLGG